MHVYTTFKLIKIWPQKAHRNIFINMSLLSVYIGFVRDPSGSDRFGFFLQSCPIPIRRDRFSQQNTLSPCNFRLYFFFYIIIRRFHCCPHNHYQKMNQLWHCQCLHPLNLHHHYHIGHCKPQL